MSSGSFRQVEVRCPFYHHDDGYRKITCEGIVDDSSLSLNYRHKKDFEIQVTVFCCQHYENCEVHQMLMRKYEDDEME